MARNLDKLNFGRLPIYSLHFASGRANWLNQDAKSQLGIHLSDEPAFPCLYFRLYMHLLLLLLFTYSYSYVYNCWS